MSESIDDLVREVTSYVTALQAENAKLREERDEWKRVAEPKQDIIDHMRDANHENAKLREENECFIVKLNAEHIARQNVESENAKLRELVRDMWREGAFEAGACYEKAAERLEERTRELGIEVYG